MQRKLFCHSARRRARLGEDRRAVRQQEGDGDGVQQRCAGRARGDERIPQRPEQARRQAEPRVVGRMALPFYAVLVCEYLAKLQAVDEPLLTWVLSYFV